MANNNAVINFNTNARLKSEAKKVLDEMGLNFSIALNAYLKRLIVEKRIEFTTPEIPNARLIKSFADARKEYASGKMKGYKTFEELKKHLLSL
ncbi:MAG: type II toxin-antitoxin system RelB/DinJ family antitoxin [Patescibacteria group bacterium]